VRHGVAERGVLMIHGGWRKDRLMSRRIARLIMTGSSFSLRKRNVMMHGSSASQRKLRG